jgi:hypothetical protein
LKSEHDTYEAAEKTASEIKRRHPQLHVTVYDTKGQQYTIIEQPKLAGASKKDRLTVRAARNTLECHHALKH